MPRSQGEPASAAAAKDSSPTWGPRGPGWTWESRSGRSGRRRAREPRAGSVCPQPHRLRRGSPLARRSASLRGLALASAPWPCPGPGAPRRVPDRPAAGAPPASVCLSDARALRCRRRAPASSAALWRSWGNGLGTAVPQHTHGRPGGRARRSLRAGILPPTPRPPAPLPLDCGRRKPLHERAPARARPRPARRRPDSGGAWTRGPLQLRRGPASSPRPGRLPGRRGRAWARLRNWVCLLARSCLIMVYFLPERLL